MFEKKVTDIIISAFAGFGFAMFSRWWLGETAFSLWSFGLGGGIVYYILKSRIPKSH